MRLVAPVLFSLVVGCGPRIPVANPDKPLVIGLPLPDGADSCASVGESEVLESGAQVLFVGVGQERVQLKDDVELVCWIDDTFLKVWIGAPCSAWKTLPTVAGCMVDEQPVEVRIGAI